MSTTTTRRALLSNTAAGAALTVPVVAAAATEKPTATDPHLAWLAEIERIDARPAEDDAAFDADCAAIFRLQDLIAATPARTLAGVRVQVALALNCHQDGSVLGETEGLAIENAVAALERLAPSA